MCGEQRCEDGGLWLARELECEDVRAYRGVGICESVEEGEWRGLAATRGREVIPKVTQNPTLTVPKPGKCTPGEPWEHHSDFLHVESTGTLRVLAVAFHFPLRHTTANCWLQVIKSNKMRC